MTKKPGSGRYAIKQWTCIQCETKFCGVKHASSKPNLCTGCYGLYKIAKQLMRESLLQRMCRNCNKLLNSTDRRKNYCCNQCGYEARKHRTLTLCCIVCNQPVLRRVNDNTVNPCCGRACQNAWALQQRRGRRTGKLTSAQEGRKLKHKWKIKYRRQRRSNNLWLKTIDCELTKINTEMISRNKPQTTKDRWIGRIKIRLACNEGRHCIKRCKQKRGGNAIEALKALQQRVKSKAKQNQNPWMPKINNKISNLRKRIARKNAKQSQSSFNLSKARICKFQMQFEWD